MIDRSRRRLSSSSARPHSLPRPSRRPSRSLQRKPRNPDYEGPRARAWLERVPALQGRISAGLEQQGGQEGGQAIGVQGVPGLQEAVVKGAEWPRRDDQQQLLKVVVIGEELEQGLQQISHRLLQERNLPREHGWRRET